MLHAAIHVLGVRIKSKKSILSCRLAKGEKWREHCAHPARPTALRMPLREAEDLAPTRCHWFPGKCLSPMRAQTNKQTNRTNKQKKQQQQQQQPQPQPQQQQQQPQQQRGARVRKAWECGLKGHSGSSPGVQMLRQLHMSYTQEIFWVAEDHQYQDLVSVQSASMPIRLSGYCFSQIAKLWGSDFK